MSLRDPPCRPAARLGAAALLEFATAAAGTRLVAPGRPLPSERLGGVALAAGDTGEQGGQARPDRGGVVAVTAALRERTRAPVRALGLLDVPERAVDVAC